MNSIIVPADAPGAVEDATAWLRRGGLVAIPTETVYGLGADATNGVSVARIFEAKGRPRFNPLICHVCDLAMAGSLARFDALALQLADAFWPGPLTLVLPARAGAAFHPLVAAGLPNVALRMPRGIARDVIAALGRPVAAPSANRSGRVSPTTAAHVAASLGVAVDMILDGGSCAIGLESTIVRPQDGRLVLLREGGITAEALAASTGLEVVAPERGAGIEAPGQMISHYAPLGAVRLNATHVAPGEWLLRFGPGEVAGEANAAGVLDLSPSGDLRQAAARLFAVLSEVDRPDVAAIAVMPIPATGLGAAINDRLRRAAAPRGPANRH